MLSPGAVARVLRIALRADVVHVHLSRDLVTAPAAFLLSFLPVRMVLQPHGMIKGDKRRLARAMDKLLLARAFRKSHSVIALNANEASELKSMFPASSSRVRVIANRVELPDRVTPPPERTEFLFVGRLESRKRPALFANAALQRLREGSDAVFTLIGPDEGQAAAVQDFASKADKEGYIGAIRWEGALEPELIQDRMSRAAVVVLPSLSEPFGLTLIEGMSVGRPVILSSDAYLAPVVLQAHAGRTFDGGLNSLIDAIKAFEDDPKDRADRGRNARRLVANSYSDKNGEGDDDLFAVYAPVNSTRSRRVLWVANVAAPYRRPVWEHLGAEDLDLTVGLLQQDKTLGKDHRNRSDNWLSSSYNPEHYKYSKIAALSMRRGEAVYYLFSWRACRAAFSADYIVLAGWESPIYWVLLGICKLRGTPTIGFYESTLATNKYSSGLIASIRRRFFKALDSVVVPGGASLEAVTSFGVDADKVSVGFNAVDVAWIHREAGAVRDESQLAPSNIANRCLYLGQLIERKNIMSLLQALLIPGAEGVELDIVGTGEMEQMIQRRIVEHGLGSRVQVHGSQPYENLPTIFSLHSTLVLASSEEVWGLVLNEALAAGLHVVVSSEVGAARSIANMKVVYICGSDPESIANAIAESTRNWVGPIEEPEILKYTPELLASIFSDLIDKLPSRRRR